jgi:hypothetical protein
MHDAGPKTELSQHQKAVDKELAELSKEDREDLKYAQTVADADQSGRNQYRHAMCDGESKQTVTEAKKLANEYVRSALEKAMKYEEISKKYAQEGSYSLAKFMHRAAMSNLGYAIHTLQDNTSPAHRGFQTWNEDGCFIGHAYHGWKERSYPDDDAELRKATRLAHDVFSKKKPMPANFFK